MAQNAERVNSPRNVDRGIRNATAVTRHTKREHGRTMQSNLQNKTTANDAEYNSTEENPEYDTGNNHQSRARAERNARLQTMQEVRKLFSESGESLSDADEKELTEMQIRPPSLPGFPYIIFPIAVLKDLLDFGDLTIVGIVVTTVLSFVLSVILFLWILGKMGGSGLWKRRRIGKLLIRWGITVTIEFIPLFKIIPTNVIFVLLTHYDETKIVKLINTGLERLRGKTI